MINDIAGAIGISMACVFFLLFLLKRFDKICFKSYKECDKPDYFAVARYIQTAMDVWSDYLFVYAMYLQNEMDYFYLSGIFVLAPLLFSVLLLVYWMHRWHTMISSLPQRLTDFLDKYTATFVFYTIFGTFGSCVSLLQSRFLLDPVFNFPLKKSENQRLLIWKFINDTILEVE